MYIKVGVAVVLLAVIVGYHLYDNFDVGGAVSGKRVVVTGASTGIGEQMAYHYARMGARLIITARREERLKAVIQECRRVGRADGDYHYVVADMAKFEGTQKVIDAARDILGGIDFLVLNHIIPIALGGWLGKPENFTNLDKIMNVNFKAYVYLASQATDMLIDSKGSIVVVSSVAGRISPPYSIPYATSKFALDGFFSGLRQEFIIRRTDISITICILSLIGTDSALNNLKQFGLEDFLESVTIPEPADAAYAIIRGGAMREREIYFPYLGARILTLFRDWAPALPEALMRYSYSQAI